MKRSSSGTFYGPCMRANVYVDGFNLYYSALRTRFPDCKWLDLNLLAATLFPTDTIQRVRYFTARISARPDDPQQVTRQQAYLRALAATGVHIHLGQFRHDRRYMRRAQACADPDCPSGSTIEMLYTEEKGSDVNLATYLMRDAALKDCELAIVLTNDTDLLEPIRLARAEFGVRVILLSPAERPSTTLLGSVDAVKKLRRGALQACQLPTNLRDPKGDIHRPRSWRPVP